MLDVYTNRTDDDMKLGEYSHGTATTAVDLDGSRFYKKGWSHFLAFYYC